jgi:hypothetical protein
MRTIRASEIGTFLYCSRAWHYQRQGLQSENQAELAAGSELHRRHGRVVAINGCLRLLAYVFLLLALAILTVHFVGSFA